MTATEQAIPDGTHTAGHGSELAEAATMLDIRPSTVIARPEEAAAMLAASWLDCAGQRLAYAVASGEMCDRCARAALSTIGLAGGIPPGMLARDGLGGFGWLLQSTGPALPPGLSGLDRGPGTSPG